MMRGPRVVSTHTSDAFVDFAYDLLDCVMHELGCVWHKPSDYKRRSKKLFKEYFGHVVILFRSRNRRDFNQLFSLCVEMEDTDDILVYVAKFRATIFKGEVPLMEFIAYCAFLVDMAVITYQLEDPDLIYNIVDDTADVFNKYIKRYFTVVGGWYALYRVAEQYLNYVIFEPQTSTAASVAKGDTDKLKNDAE